MQRFKIQHLKEFDQDSHSVTRRLLEENLDYFDPNSEEYKKEYEFMLIIYTQLKAYALTYIFDSIWNVRAELDMLLDDIQMKIDKLEYNSSMSLLFE